jgi:hypothetical protein
METKISYYHPDEPRRIMEIYYDAQFEPTFESAQELLDQEKGPGFRIHSLGYPGDALDDLMTANELAHGHRLPASLCGPYEVETPWAPAFARKYAK